MFKFVVVSRRRWWWRFEIARVQKFISFKC